MAYTKKKSLKKRGGGKNSLRSFADLSRSKSSFAKKSAKRPATLSSAKSSFATSFAKRSLTMSNQGSYGPALLSRIRSQHNKQYSLRSHKEINKEIELIRKNIPTLFSMQHEVKKMLDMYVLLSNQPVSSRQPLTEARQIELYHLQKKILYIANILKEDIPDTEKTDKCNEFIERYKQHRKTMNSSMMMVREQDPNE